jgi:hypothetical protein
MKEAGPQATLGTHRRGRRSNYQWCHACGHQVEPDPIEMAERCGTEVSVIESKRAARPL